MATKVFGLEGCRFPEQSNKCCLESDINEYVKNVNVWDVTELTGVKSLDNFKVMWENYITSKPKPNKKTKKRALIHSLAVITRSLNEEVQSLGKQFKDAQEVRLLQDATIENLKSELAKREKKYELICTQKDALTRQMEEVMGRCQYLENELSNNAVKFNDSKATIRHLLDDKRQQVSVSADHTKCQEKIVELEQKLGLARGFVSAINEGIEKDIYENTLLTKQLVEGMMEPIITTEVFHPGDPTPVVKYERRILSPEQARAVGQNLGPCRRSNALNWMAKLARTNLTSDDILVVLRECLLPKDFIAFPADLATTINPYFNLMFKAIYNVFYPNDDIRGTYYTDKQLEELYFI
nr:uncharacterized protein LOC112546572 [Pelodiscus sinensis]|eukprot:XP_025042929.1 uncharacterized protein LOC112546572 [Pelodiscus sinensis]